MSRFDVHYVGGPLDGKWGAVEGDSPPPTITVASLALATHNTSPDNVSEFVQLEHHIYGRGLVGSFFRTNDHYVYNYQGIKPI